MAHYWHCTFTETVLFHFEDSLPGCWGDQYSYELALKRSDLKDVYHPHNANKHHFLYGQVVLLAHFLASLQLLPSACTSSRYRVWSLTVSIGHYCLTLRTHFLVAGVINIVVSWLWKEPIIHKEIDVCWHCVGGTHLWDHLLWHNECGKYADKPNIRSGLLDQAY